MGTYYAEISPCVTPPVDVQGDICPEYETCKQKHLACSRFVAWVNGSPRDTGNRLPSACSTRCQNTCQAPTPGRINS